MIVKCRKCKSKNSMKLDGSNMTCIKCGEIIMSSFSESDGSVFHEHNVDIEIPAGSSLAIYNIHDSYENSRKAIYDTSFPSSPYINGKKVKKYRIVGTVKIEMYYE